MLTVTVPAANQDLTTLATVKAELGITDTASDAQLSKFITQASAIIAQHCNRTFLLETVVETFRPKCGSTDLILSRYPVSIASILDGTTALISTDYEANLTTGIIDRLDTSGRNYRWQAGNVAVTYQAGYTLANLPGGVQRACIQLVSQYVASDERDPMVRSETDDGVGSTEYFSPPAGMGTDVLELLELHVRPNA